MPNYIRPKVFGGTFFLTIKTYEHRPLFCTAANVDIVRAGLREVNDLMPFDVVAGVVLPDHLHFIWALPRDDERLPARVGKFKLTVTKMLKVTVGGAHPTESRIKHRESDVWQRRYHDHLIRDESDFEGHLNYVHWNPVKHGLVRCPHEWPYSSFQNWVDRNVYDEDWRCSCRGQRVEAPSFSDEDFGE